MGYGFSIFFILPELNRKRIRRPAFYQERSPERIAENMVAICGKTVALVFFKKAPPGLDLANSVNGFSAMLISITVPPFA